jgi:hypothetical protein
MKTLILFLCFAVGFILCSCGEKSGDAEKLKRDSAGAVLLSEGKLSEKPSDEVIMKLLYGDFNGTAANWSPKEKKFDKELTDFAEGEPLVTTIILKEAKTIDGIEKIFVITQSNIEGNDCRVCAPAIGAFVFAKKDSCWSCEIKNYYIGEIGAYGDAQDVRLIEIGPKTTGLLFEVVDMAQGYNYEGTLIYAMYKGHFAEGISFQTLGDNSGTEEDQWKKSATYKFQPSSDPEYFELIIETTGTEYDDNTNRIVNASSTKKYAFREGKYRQVNEVASK